MATLYAQRLNTSVVLLHKTRETGTETRVTHLVGDVRGQPCLVVDDMISTGGTILEAVERLLQDGARPDGVSRPRATSGMGCDSQNGQLRSWTSLIITLRNASR
jgi:orotate phosphoribosyltransferase-like protein